MIANEDAARAWFVSRDVPRETMVKFDRFAALLREANGRQNLIAASTLDAMWVRHFLDSAQLVDMAPKMDSGCWVDLGAGAGLPGIVVALLLPGWSVRLIESRKLRCEFLRHIVAALDLGEGVQVHERRVERHPPEAHDVISARAFAPLPELLRKSQHLAGEHTIWLLPKGRNAVNELSTLEPTWQSLFHVEPSLTDADAGILVGKGRAKSG